MSVGEASLVVVAVSRTTPTCNDSTAAGRGLAGRLDHVDAVVDWSRSGCCTPSRRRCPSAGGVHLAVGAHDTADGGAAVAGAVVALRGLGRGQQRDVAGRRGSRWTRAPPGRSRARRSPGRWSCPGRRRGRASPGAGRASRPGPPRSAGCARWRSAEADAARGREDRAGGVGDGDVVGVEPIDAGGDEVHHGLHLLGGERAAGAGARPAPRPWAAAARRRRRPSRGIARWTTAASTPSIASMVAASSPSIARLKSVCSLNSEVDRPWSSSSE